MSMVQMYTTSDGLRINPDPWIVDLNGIAGVGEH